MFYSSWLSNLYELSNWGQCIELMTITRYCSCQSLALTTKTSSPYVNTNLPKLVPCPPHPSILPRLGISHWLLSHVNLNLPSVERWWLKILQFFGGHWLISNPTKFFPILHPLFSKCNYFFYQDNFELLQVFPTIGMDRNIFISPSMWWYSSNWVKTLSTTTSISVESVRVTLISKNHSLRPSPNSENTITQ